MRYLFLLGLLLVQVSFAGMYAITETGEKVFLRDDGTWNKVKGKEADHVDLKANPLKLNVKFKNRSILEMEKRNELLPKGVSDKELNRQIKKLPKSRMVLYVAPESVSKTKPKVLKVVLRNSRGRVVYNKRHNDNRAYKSGVPGWLILAEMNFKSTLKGKYKLTVKDVATGNSMEYEIEAEK